MWPVLSDMRSRRDMFACERGPHVRKGEAAIHLEADHRREA